MIDSLRHFLKRSARRSNDNERGGDFLNRFIRWRQRQKDIDLLREMPDYLLKDIGISRGEIEQVTRGPRKVVTSNTYPATDLYPSTLSRRRRLRRSSVQW